jgi:hypothetical protein
LVSALRQPHVSTIGLEAQDLRINQRVENGFAHRPLNAAEARHLVEREAQTRHFEKFGLDTVKNLSAQHETLVESRTILRWDLGRSF